MTEEGLSSNIVKYFARGGPGDLASRTRGGEGGPTAYSWPARRRQTLKAGGQLRLKLAKDNGLLEGKGHQFVWVVDCPLFQADPVTGKLASFHHPVRAAGQRGHPLRARTCMNLKGNSYDLVLNGSEIGSGSLRNHDAEVQRKMFKALGMSEEQHGEGVRLLPGGAGVTGPRPTAASAWAWTGCAPSCWAARASVTSSRSRRTRSSNPWWTARPTQVDQSKLDELQLMSLADEDEES